MRSWLLFACGMTLLFAAPADARPKRAARAKVEPLDIVVLPFSVLAATKAQETKEALELELELVDNTRVVDGEQVLADLNAAGDGAFSAVTLSRVMKKRGIEVLVATPPGLMSTAGKPLVVAYASDGRPREFREIATSAGVDQIAATVFSFLKPGLGKWRSLPVAKLPAKTSRPDVDDDDVFLPDRSARRSDADDDDDASAGRNRRPAAGETSANGGDTADRSRSQRGSRSTRTVDENDDAATDNRPSRLSDDEEESGPQRRRGSLDERDVSGLEGERRSLFGDNEDSADRRQLKEQHLLALSGSFAGATWYYNFEGNDGVQPDPVQAGFYPGGSVRADLWPLPWLGLDASASLAAVQFQINSSATLQINPGKFVSWHSGGGAAVKARYTLRLADDGVVRLVGIGARLGYRYWGATVEQQVVADSNKTLTVVPGFQLHSLAIGPELYLPLFVGERRFELELKVDVLPATFYSEQPDNPGASSLAFGFSAEALVRLDLFGGFFLEVVGHSTGLTINFEGEGDRVTVGGADPNGLVPLQGGRALNISAGASLGVGFMF